MHQSIKSGENIYVTLSHSLNVNPIPNVENFCTPEMNLEFDACLVDGIAESLKQEFGCIVPYLKFATNLENYEICNFPKNETLTGEAGGFSPLLIKKGTI